MNNYPSNIGAFTNLDSAQTIFFLQELTQMKTRVYERPLPILKANELIPTDTTTDPGAEAINYTMYDRTVGGKIIANYADDLPLVDVMGKLVTNPIKSYGNAFEISIQDLKAAMFARKNLSISKVRAALESHLIFMNNTAFFGVPEAGLTGWLTNPFIASAPVAGDTAPHRLWAYKATIDPALIVADLNEIAKATMNSTSGIYQADTIVMPLTQYNLIQGLRMGSGTDTTVLEFFLRNNPGISIRWADELKGAFSTLDGMIAYRNRIEDFWQEIPQAFEMLAPQWNNLAYKVPCHSRHGGTVVARPETQVIRTGI